MSDNKKIRSANYTSQEKDLLVNLAAKFKNIIENKKTDAVSVSEKAKTWQKIANEFNTITPNLCYRSCDSLKKFYENKKKEIRKKMAEYKKETYLTGGGPPPKDPTESSDELLLEIVSDKSVFGLKSPFDSDKIATSISPKILQVSEEPEEHLSSIACAMDNDVRVITEEINESTPSYNDIEIIMDDNLSLPPVCETPKTNWASYKPSDLKNLPTEQLKRSSQNNKPEAKKKKTDETHSRRRPHSTIKVASASSLYEKYEVLVDKKLVNENFISQEIQLKMDCMRRKHELEIKLLELDIELKKKQLQSLKCDKI